MQRYERLLAERFPHLRSVSIQLLERNMEFVELCEEYTACVEALERLSDAQGDAAMKREYAALRLRIEGELLRYIGEHQGTPP